MTTHPKTPKLAIRQDDENGCVFAYFATMDEKHSRLVASLDIRLAREIPGLFDRWKDMLSDALRHELTDMGVKVEGMQEIKLHEKQ